MRRRRRWWGVVVQAQESLSGIRGVPGLRAVPWLVRVVGRGGHSGRVGGQVSGVWAGPATLSLVGIVGFNVRMLGRYGW